MKVFKGLTFFVFLLHFILASSSQAQSSTTVDLEHAELIVGMKVGDKLKGYEVVSVKPFASRKDHFQALVTDGKNDMSIIVLPSGHSVGPVLTNRVNEIFKDGSSTKAKGTPTITSIDIAKAEVSKYLSATSGFKVINTNEVKQSNGSQLYKFEVEDALGNMFDIEYNSFGIKKHLIFRDK